MTKSEDPVDPEIGAGVLSQTAARYGHMILIEESLQALLELVQCEDDPDVLVMACFALEKSSYDDPRVAPALVKLKNHPDADVRYAMVHGLLTREEDAAVEALIELSNDQDDDVRNWATFGLAQQVDTDTPEIRTALWARIDDEDPEIRGEALLGLAKRHDQGVIEPLIRELRRIGEAPDNFWDHSFEACIMMPNLRLYSELKALEEPCGNDTYLLQALAMCRIPSPDEYEEPNDRLSTCQVCGLRRAFAKNRKLTFCKRCGWVCDSEQRADPDSYDDGKLNQERERWKKRLEEGKKNA